ncbi:hypothetical protein EVAR_57558_1 [Eumeta japonica]|uniref:TNFR-Cys domain-containing protein n=1 Tax=Eumeta variegata TaxID=151549 RepID=A0A4C2A4G4_EUMVA|nr:hypothetical protein EVAR_57558_1 [Eumeta japonica]
MRLLALLMLLAVAESAPREMCGQVQCQSDEYCSIETNQCMKCQKVCDKTHHNYEAKVCEDRSLGTGAYPPISHSGSCRLVQRYRRHLPLTRIHRDRCEFALCAPDRTTQTLSLNVTLQPLYACYRTTQEILSAVMKLDTKVSQGGKIGMRGRRRKGRRALILRNAIIRRQIRALVDPPLRDLVTALKTMFDAVPHEGNGVKGVLEGTEFSPDHCGSSAAPTRTGPVRGLRSNPLMRNKKIVRGYSSEVA